MNSHPHLNSFRHSCQSDCLIFVIELPEKCPKCHEKLVISLIDSPSRVPSPFFHPTQVNSCLIVKPNQGDFITSYTDGCDLHIGAIDSKGFIYEFSSSGLSKLNTANVDEMINWKQIIPININLNQPHGWQENWDKAIESTSHMNCWTSSSYDEYNSNCFTFIMSFLEQFGLEGETKETFTQKYILPKINSAKLYINWYRKVLEDGYFIIEQVK